MRKQNLFTCCRVAKWNIYKVKLQFCHTEKKTNEKFAKQNTALRRCKSGRYLASSISCSNIAPVGLCLYFKNNRLLITISFVQQFIINYIKYEFLNSNRWFYHLNDICTIIWFIRMNHAVLEIKSFKKKRLLCHPECARIPFVNFWLHRCILKTQ